MGKVWVLDTETKGTGAEMVPLEKVLKKAPPRPAPVLLDRPKPVKPPAPREPWRFKIVEVMTREVVGEGVDARTTVDLLKSFRSVVDVSVYAWDQATERWRALTLGERRRLWSLRDRGR